MHVYLPLRNGDGSNKGLGSAYSSTKSEGFSFVYCSCRVPVFVFAKKTRLYLLCQIGNKTSCLSLSGSPFLLSGEWCGFACAVCLL